MRLLPVLTQVRTPQDIFFAPQRLLVPLFQRPYVWNEDLQWHPLWTDVRRLTEYRMQGATSATHFLGAIVLQQQPTQVGSLGLRTVIDGQQRLTTLQVLLDAVHQHMRLRGHKQLARQIRGLTENPEEFRASEEDRFKVWPTNRDRPAFNEVMSAEAPVRYEEFTRRSSRLVAAHRFFSEAVGAWLDEGDDARAFELVTSLRTQLQLVTIDLQIDEDAQAIFETLNARGTPLTAADLIKNFVFQSLDLPPPPGAGGAVLRRLLERVRDSVLGGRGPVGAGAVQPQLPVPHQWLVAATLADVPARAVFADFKRFVEHAGVPMAELLPRIARAAARYRSWIEGAQRKDGALDRVELFVYRTSTLESEVIRPVLIWLTDDRLDVVPDAQLRKALDVLESWTVRRRLARVASQGLNRVVVDLLRTLAESPRSEVGDRIERFLLGQTSTVAYWPSDREVRAELTDLPVYKRFSRGRLRMVLEALEDHTRGWHLSGRSLHEAPVVRSTCSIEHLMPQEWRAHWSEPEVDAAERDAAVDLLGNLTLVTSALNSSVSNAAWYSKRANLRAHTSVRLTLDVTEHGLWNEAAIRTRTHDMIDRILAIWSVPDGHDVRPAARQTQRGARVELADLVRAGLLEAGQRLWAKPTASAGRTCEVGTDGRLLVGTRWFDAPSPAAQAISGAASEAGWDFWLTAPSDEGGRPITELRLVYLERAEATTEDDLS